MVRQNRPEIAGASGASLDGMMVRKPGTPGREELAMGAIASGGVWVLSPDVVAHLALSTPAAPHSVPATVALVA